MIQMLVIFRLATFQSRHITPLSTLLSAPPPPSRDKITNFLQNINPKNIPNFPQKSIKIQKIKFLNSQIQTCETELQELKYLTQTNPELSEIGQKDSETISNTIDALHTDILAILYDLVLDAFPNECIIEIRSAAGGAEASLFARDLYSMYAQLANRRKWILEEFESNKTELGGFKSVSFGLQGNSCYDDLRFEAGVHRVQRVPYTSGAGRIHTSTVTVAVLSVPKEEEVVINNSDLRIEAVRATGAGGQYVNTTDSAVRVTHIPTGIIVACQIHRSQIKNKQKALDMLRAKLFDLKNSKTKNERLETRRNQVGYGDRSEKIRTYNFPDDRITDHRIGQTIKGVSSYLSGELSDVFTNRLKYVNREIQLSELLDSNSD
ncbi:Peptide chain release factor 1 [Oopsacas minuta]|uniref:Peptide chain release factor 1 n=1 Tax=Oopsacas minuta TaxID=111878 RepID=A0AAV7JWC0_9METZ|nr:Peptide chain release factor 1 [Oopsacas minuta]